ncbi:MAG TPA: hypothetical protein VH917_05405 [Ignavibacteriaceae bacterium]
MKKLLLLIIVIISCTQAIAQIEVKAVMGVNFSSVPSMQDYINFTHPDDQLGSFNSAIIFAAEGGYFFSPSFVLSVEGAYQLFSYTNVSSSAGKYELVFSTIPVSALGYFVLGGEGYNLKFGGGVGPRFVIVEESLPGSGSTQQYTSTGVGLIIRIEGNTLLGGDFYANIGTELRYDVNGEPENNGDKLTNNVYNENVNFNTFALGVRLGFSYYFSAN